MLEIEVMQPNIQLTIQCCICLEQKNQIYFFEVLEIIFIIQTTYDYMKSLQLLQYEKNEQHIFKLKFSAK